MTSNSISTPPPVSWAQRTTQILLTYNVECDKPDLKIEKNIISFKGTCAPDQKLHELTIQLYDEIDPDKSSFVNKGRLIEVVLAKVKTEQAFWPTLTKDNKKHHWLKVDFERWQDEDESEDEFDMFSNKVDDFGDDNEKDNSGSSDEEDLPDIQ